MRQYKVRGPDGRVFVIEAPAGAFEVGDVLHTEPPLPMRVIGGWPTADELAEQGGGAARPVSDGAEGVGPEAGSTCADGSGRASPLAHGSLVDPAELVAAASDPSMTLRRLRLQWGVGYTRARRLLETYNPAWEGG